jgi:hypothetical protein
MLQEQQHHRKMSPIQKWLMAMQKRRNK